MKTIKFKNITEAVFVLLIFAACNKKEVAADPDKPSDGTNVLQQDISKDTSVEGQWVLDGVVHIKSGATLTIQAGTVITSKTDDDKIDILVVDQGAKLRAVGTEDQPIIFTSAKAEAKVRAGENVINDDAWGGIVINGYGTINTGATGVGEYTPTGAYGGNNDDDNSGELKYVYLKYPGYSFTEEKQLNGFSFYAVGSKTILDHLAVYRGFDDAFEFWGGKAKITNVFACYVIDDSIDWTDGWRGGVDNAVVILANTSDKGIEADNQEIAAGATPVSNPILRNVFIYQDKFNDQQNVPNATAFNFRRGTNGSMTDFYVWSVGTVFKIDGPSQANFKNNTLSFTNINIDKDISKLAYEKAGDASYTEIKTGLEANAEIKKTTTVNATTPVSIPGFVASMKQKMGVN